MKKRIVSLILCIVLSAAVLPFSAMAAKGPSTEKYVEYGYEYYPAFGRFYELDSAGDIIYDEETYAASYKSFYGEGTVKNEMPGAVYDITGGQNTLKLTNLNAPNYLLSANMLGEDFTIEVTGTCRLGGIYVYGWGYGGSLTVEGTGTLILNENKLRANAIAMEKEEAPNFFLSFGSQVSVDLYAGKGGNTPVRLSGLASESERPISFANGTPDYAVTADYNQLPTWIEGYYADDVHEDGGFKVVNKNDPDGLYSAGIYTVWNYDFTPATSSEVIRIYRFVYCPELLAYVIDDEYTKEHFNTDHGEIEFETESEMNAAGYSYVRDGDSHVYNNFLSCYWLMSEDLYVDPEGNDYVFHTVYDSQGNETEVPYSAIPIDGYEDRYVFFPLPSNSQLNTASLLPKVKQVFYGYSATIAGSEYHYKGSDKKPLPFKDVKEGMWYTEGIRYCYEHGLMNGTSATTFAPNSPFTRAMFVTVLANIEGADVSAYKGKKTSFKDVKISDWFAPYVEWAYANGYTNGTGVGIFSPNTAVTREMIAQFFYNYSSKKGYDVSQADDLARFTDKNTVSGWAKRAVQWAVACKLINGLSPTTLAPKNTATRAQVALISATYHEGLMKFA